MDIEIKMNQWIQSKQFIQEQYLFEKAVLDKIVVECSTKREEALVECRNKYLTIRQQYKQSIYDYFKNQQQELYVQMKQKCIKLNDEAVVKCLSEFNRDKEVQSQMNIFKEERRRLTQSLMN